MIEYRTDQFKKDLLELGVTLDDHQIDQFITYYKMLVEWNEVMNLTAITEYDDVLNRQRELIYRERDNILAGEDLYSKSEDIRELERNYRIDDNVLKFIVVRKDEE